MDKIVFPTANGVVVHCDDKKVISATNCDGKKKLKSFRAENKIVFWHFPFARGLQYFFCGIVGFFQALMLSYDICNSQFKTNGKDINSFYTQKLIKIGLTAVLAIIFSALFLGYLPGKLGYFLVDYHYEELLRNFVIMLLKVGLFYLFIASLRVFPVVNELFRFNKALFIALHIQQNEKAKKLQKIKNKLAKDEEKNEKSVKGEKKTKSKDVKSKEKGKNNKKRHKGFAVLFKNVKNVPNFLNFVVFVFILDFVVITLWGADYGFWFNIAFHLAMLLASASVAYELLWLTERFKCLSWCQYLSAFLVFAKPTITHVETVNVALTEMNLLCSQKGREFMEDENKKAFSIVYNEVRNKLSNAGINEKSETDWLIATVLGKNRAEIKLVPFVSDKQYQDVLKATDRRAKGESLDNIFGFTEFYGLRFDVNKKVLTPRMETELLVEQVLKAQNNFKNATILDLGTGSGAISVAVAKNCDASVTAVDISKMALAVAQNNAKQNGVEIEFLHSNLFEGLKRKRKFDIIVSNPPYIPTEDIEKLDKNVKDCDPHIALDGGKDGLDFYREIISQAPKRLNDGGMIFFEVGKGQAGAVKKLLKENGFVEIRSIKDYSKIERIVCGKIS